ncbi:MAG: hypothetical protein LBN00_09675 [Oscillospiraceae bacterium]|jgi:hypothetical protein|nr:hypothetical protein [Oscillospiraceae bacterium]
MKIKKILAPVIIVLVFAVIIVGSALISRWITDSNPDVARFDFEYIEINGVKLSEDNRQFVVDVGGEGVSMWIEWINRKENNTITDIKTVEEAQFAIKNNPDKKGWEDKDAGLKYIEYHDQHIGEQREKVDITLRFIYRDSDSILVRVSVDWKENA